MEVMPTSGSLNRKQGVFEAYCRKTSGTCTMGVVVAAQSWLSAALALANSTAG